MNVIQHNSLSSVLKPAALVVLATILLFAAQFAHAQYGDVIPGVMEGSNIVLSTIRLAAPIIAVAAIIVGCLLWMVDKISSTWLLRVFIACVIIGFAERIVRFATGW